MDLICRNCQHVIQIIINGLNIYSLCYTMKDWSIKKKLVFVGQSKMIEEFTFISICLVSC